MASTRISDDSEWYARQKLLVAEDFIERLDSSGLDVFHRFLPERIESSRFRVGLDLAIPSIIEIHFGQTLKKLGFVSLRQFSYRFDDFTHCAHGRNLVENFPDEKREERMKEELGIKNSDV